jgi:hypothetical protein
MVLLVLVVVYLIGRVQPDPHVPALLERRDVRAGSGAA